MEDNQVKEYVCEDYGQTRYKWQVKSSLIKLFTGIDGKLI